MVTATKDRTALVADLGRLKAEQAEQLAPLQEARASAQDALESVLAETGRKVQAARDELGAADAAVRELNSTSETDAIVRELRASAPASIAEFGAWVQDRIDDLGEMQHVPQAEIQRRSRAANLALQGLLDLALLDDAALEQRIAELKAEIEGDTA